MVFEAFHLCGHRKVTAKHTDVCPRTGFRGPSEQGPQCDDHKREFHYHQSKCDLCMIGKSNSDLVYRDISGLYLSEKDIEEIRKGATFQSHKELSTVEAEPQVSKEELVVAQALAKAQVEWKRQWYEDLRIYRLQGKKYDIPEWERAQVYDSDADNSDFLKEFDVKGSVIEICHTCYKYASPNKLRKLPCGHIFYLDCLRLYFTEIIQNIADCVEKNG